MSKLLPNNKETVPNIHDFILWWNLNSKVSIYCNIKHRMKMNSENTYKRNSMSYGLIGLDNKLQNITLRTTPAAIYGTV